MALLLLRLLGLSGVAGPGNFTYIVLEEDGTSKITLEEDGGSLILEENT